MHINCVSFGELICYISVEVIQKVGKEMIHIYLCEDDASQLQFFTDIIKQYIAERNMDADVFSARCNPENTLKDIDGNGDHQALFLLDVELNGYDMNGFDLCREIKKRNGNFFFAFLTSKDELAYKAFEYELDILDYILKEPKYFLNKVISKDLKKRLDRIFEKIEREKVGKNATIWVECGSRKVEIEIDSMICIQSIKGEHHLEIITENRRLIVNQSLEQMKGILADRVIEVSKSCLVMKAKIQEIDRKKRFVTMKNGMQCEIAFRKVKEVWNEFEVKKAGMV